MLPANMAALSNKLIKTKFVVKYTEGSSVDEKEAPPSPFEGASSSAKRLNVLPHYDCCMYESTFTRKRLANNNNNNSLILRLYPQEPELRGATKQNH